MAPKKKLHAHKPSMGHPEKPNFRLGHPPKAASRPACGRQAPHSTECKARAHRLKPVPRKPEAKAEFRSRRQASPPFDFFMWGLPLQSWRDGVPFVEAGGMKNESLTSARTERGRDVSYRTPSLGAFGPGGEVLLLLGG